MRTNTHLVNLISQILEARNNGDISEVARLKKLAVEDLIAHKFHKERPDGLNVSALKRMAMAQIQSTIFMFTLYEE